MRIQPTYKKTPATFARQKSIDATVQVIGEQIKNTSSSPAMKQALETQKIALEDEHFALELEGMPTNLQATMKREREMKRKKEQRETSGK